MHSPARAIAWEFRQRHRWGLIGLGGYFLILAAIRLIVLTPWRHADLDEQAFAFVVVVPITATFMYFLGVFTFGLSGDVASRQSMYPARMFALPVTSNALAGWPMLFGAAAMMLLWLATRVLALWPPDDDVPIVWPALLAASLLAWSQALTWMSYPLRGLRVVVTVLWLAIIDAIVMIALQYKPREVVMLAILSPHLPLAYLVARKAVTRARRGDEPDWRKAFAGVGGIGNVFARRREHFSSPARAQQWFEWRRSGRSLPALIGLLLPFQLSLLFVFRDTPAIITETVIAVLLTPAFMAAFVAATVSRADAPAGDSHGLGPFLAARPITSMGLIGAKLMMTIRSTLTAWLLVLVATPLALTFSGTWPVVRDLAVQLADIVGMLRAIVLALLVVAGLIASTWKQLMQNLYIGLTGREGLIKANVFAALALLAAIGPLAHWIDRDRLARPGLWHALPWIAAILVVAKLTTAVWVASRLHRDALVRDRTLVLSAVLWDVAVLALFGLLAWLLPSLLVPRAVLMMLAILEVPLTRLAAAPLALAWNRHR